MHKLILIAVMLGAGGAPSLAAAQGPPQAEECRIVLENEGAPAPSEKCDELVERAATPTERAERLYTLAYRLDALPGGAAAALPLLERAVALAPGRGAFWHELAFAQADRGDFTGALSSIERAIALRPVDGDDVEERAFILQSLGRYAEAAADYEQVILRGGSSIELLAHLAKAQIANGDFTEARTTLERMGDSADAHAQVARLRPVIDRQERARSADPTQCRPLGSLNDRARASAVADACTAAYFAAHTDAARAAALRIRAAARNVEEQRPDAGRDDVGVAAALDPAGSANQ